MSNLISTVTASGPKNVSAADPMPVTLVTGDIEIGAVEFKNGADDTRGTVKAASTLPALTDTALVVTQRDPLPAGTNLLGKVGIDQTTPGTTNGIEGTGTALAPSTHVLTAQRPSVTQVISTALEASHILKASAGQLVGLTVFNSKASAQFILILNSATLTGDGAVTLLYPPIPIAAASILVLDLPSPVVASAGITVCNSSTGSFTKTIGSADCAFYAQVN